MLLLKDMHTQTYRILRNTELYKYNNAVLQCIFPKANNHLSCSFSQVLGASKRDAETGTVVPILQDMTETKPNKILLPPFYSLYKLKEFKWKQGLVIKLIKGYLITKTTRNYLFF